MARGETPMPLLFSTHEPPKCIASAIASLIRPGSWVVIWCGDPCISLIAMSTSNDSLVRSSSWVLVSTRQDGRRGPNRVPAARIQALPRAQSFRNRSWVILIAV